MSDLHLSAVEYICLLIGVALALVSIIHVRERYLDRKASAQQDIDLAFIWELCRYQGGGRVYTPRPMTEEQAVLYAGSLGAVMHIDPEHHKIFYRAH